MQKIINGINFLTEGIGKGVAWLTGVLVLLICYDVLMRYFANETSAWILELEWHIFALIFLLGAAYTLKHDKHVRVDLFYTKMNPKDKAWINIVGGILFLIPWCLIVLYFSIQYAMNSFSIREGSADPSGLPARYLIKFALSFGVGLLLLQAVAEVLTNITRIRTFNKTKKQ